MLIVTTAFSRSTKRPAKTVRFIAILLSFSLFIQAPFALAAQLPSGGQVVAGDVSFDQTESRLRISQSSPRAIVNWEDFGISADALVDILQPDSGSAILNRVLGGNPSELLGHLSANGRVFLINPNGVLVGEGARIDTAAFIASALDVSDGDFLSGGEMTFSGDSGAGVVNLGTINAGGDVVLIARSVENSGAIQAGTVSLAAGVEVLYVPGGDPAITILSAVDASAEDEDATDDPDGGDTTDAELRPVTGINNAGLIEAARAELRAAGGSAYEVAINQSGVIRATGIEHRDGRVFLTSGGGQIVQSGRIEAHDADGSGGQVLIGGDYRGENPSVPNAAAVTFTEAGVVDVSARGARSDGGRVIVWSDEDTSMRGTITARGGDAGGHGGFVEVSGKERLDFSPEAPVDLRAPAGRMGDLLLDPVGLTVSTAPTMDVNQGGGVVTPGVGPVSVLNNGDLSLQLQTANVTLDTTANNGDIEILGPVVWAGGSRLTVKSGDNVSISADVSGGPGSTLEILLGASPGFNIVMDEGTLNVDVAATLDVDTLRVGGNPDDVDIGNSGGIDIKGRVVVDTFEVDRSTRGFVDSVLAENTANEIGTFRSIGSEMIVGDLKVTDGAGPLDVELAISGAAINTLQLLTPGNLTLLPGTAISWLPQPVDAIFASTAGGSFINQAGASAITVDSLNNQRFFIYSDSPASTIRGGLMGAAETGKTYGSHPPSAFPPPPDSTSRFIYQDNTLPILTLTADDISRVYGDANPAFTYGVSGLQAGDTFAAVTTGAPTLSAIADMLSDAGQYTLTMGAGTLASTLYVLSYVNGLITVTPAPLSATLSQAERVYGDTTFSVDPVANYTGFKNGEDASVIAFEQFTTPSQPLDADIGTYPGVVEGRGSAPNYTLTYGLGDLLVTPRPVTLRAHNKIRPYYDPDDFTHAIINASPFDSLSDVLSTPPNLSSPAVLDSAVGMYPISISGGTPSANYTIAGYQPGTLDIRLRPVTVTAHNVTGQFGSVPTTTPQPIIDNLPAGATLLAGSNPAFDYGSSVPLDSRPGAYVDAYHPALPPGAPNPNLDITLVDGALIVTRAPLTVTLPEYILIFSERTADLDVDYRLEGVLPGYEPGVIVHGAHIRTPGTYALTVSLTGPNAELYDVAATPSTLNVQKSETQSFTIEIDTEAIEDAIKKSDQEMDELIKASTSEIVIVGPNDPITPDELREALLSDLGVEAIEDWIANLDLNAEQLAELAALGYNLETMSPQDIVDMLLAEEGMKSIVMGLLLNYIGKLSAQDSSAWSMADRILVQKFENKLNRSFDAAISKVIAKREAAQELHETQTVGLGGIFVGGDADYADYVGEVTADIAEDVSAELVGSAVAGGAFVGGILSTKLVSGLSAAIFPFAAQASGSVATVATAGGAVVAAAPIISVAIGVAAIVCGVVRTVQLVESEEHREAYNELVASAGTTTLTLADLDTEDPFMGSIAAMALADLAGGLY